MIVEHDYTATRLSVAIFSILAVATTTVGWLLVEQASYLADRL